MSLYFCHRNRAFDSSGREDLRSFKNGGIKIKVKANGTSNNEEVFLIAHTGNQLKHAIKSRLINGYAEFNIEKKVNKLWIEFLSLLRW